MNNDDTTDVEMTNNNNINTNILINFINEKFKNQNKSFDRIDEKFDQIDKDFKELKEDNKELKADIDNIKDNHLKHINENLIKIERDQHWIRILMVGVLVSIVGMILKQIFFP
ncbi:MAG: hypothetical protein LBC39_05670 [Methanobrevibacter sp.]|jgi:chromosome segregation ATPase|nr:hypothetical protein [Candidatus Methanovirga aequatorialis]